MHQSGAAPGAAPGHGLAQHGQAGQRVAAVHVADEQVREGAHQLGDRPAGGLHLDRHGDGVAVVLDQVEHGQLAVAGRVEALPELALRGGAVAGRAVDHLVLLETARDRAAFWVELGVGQVEAGLGAAHGLQELGAGGGGPGDHVQPGVAPVRGHLAAARGGVVLGPHGAQQHLLGRHAQLQHQRPVAVVAVEPVVGRLQGHAGRHQHGLVPGAADLEVDAVLALELDLLVVDATGEVHGAVDAQQGAPVELGTGQNLSRQEASWKRAQLPRTRGRRQLATERRFYPEAARRREGLNRPGGPTGSAGRGPRGPGRSPRRWPPRGRPGRSAGAAGGPRGRPAPAGPRSRRAGG